MIKQILSILCILAALCCLPGHAAADVVIGREGGSGSGTGTDDQTAAEVPFTPAGSIAATDVQDALEELDTEKTDDQTASEVTFSSTDFDANNVDAALQELFDEKQDATATLSTTGDHTGDAETVTAGQAIAQFKPVVRDWTDGEYYLADADATGRWPATGYSVTAAAGDGNTFNVVGHGEKVVHAASAFADADIQYLSDTAGGLSDTYPSGSGDCLQPILKPESARVARVILTEWGTHK